MGTRSVRLDESVYERVMAHKQEDETVSEAIDRLIGESSLLELYGLHEGDGRVDEMRDAIEGATERSRAEVERLRDRSDDR